MGDVLDDFADVLGADPSAVATPGMPAPPARGLAMVTCMDARIDPLALAGLSIGDAHVVRNAGARVTEDVVRSLVASVHLLGVRRVMIVGHTGCGLAAGSDEELRRQIIAGGGPDVGDLRLLAFDHGDQRIADDVRAVRRHPLLSPPLRAVEGFLYDVDTGELRHVPVVA